MIFNFRTEDLKPSLLINSPYKWTCNECSLCVLYVRAFITCSAMGWFVAYYVPKAWAASDPDTIRRSGYLSMLEGRMGHIRSPEEHAAHVQEMAAKK